MNSKGLIAIGIVWLLAVIMWVLFFDTSFSVVWFARSPKKTAALIAGGYILMSVYVLFLTGWLIPVAIGVHRAVRHR